MSAGDTWASWACRYSCGGLHAASCTDCAKACTPHVGHHAECKACKEACDATIEAMKAV